MLYCPTPSGKCKIDILICNNGKKYGRTCCIKCKGPKYYEVMPNDLLKVRDSNRILFDAIVYRKAKGVCQKTGITLSRSWCLKKHRVANVGKAKKDKNYVTKPECIECDRKENWQIIEEELCQN